MPIDTIDPLSSFRRHRAERGDEPYLIAPGSRSYSWRESVDLIEAIAVSLGIVLDRKGQRVAILSDNSAEWVLADWGIMLSGQVSTPLFTSMSADKVAHVIKRLDVRVLFLGPAANWQSVKSILPDDLLIVSLFDAGEGSGMMSFTEFLDIGRGKALEHVCNPGDLCSLILTSGTTGYPKAVMHSFRSLHNVANAFMHLTGQTKLSETRLFCHLPLGHIGEKTVSVVHSVITGARITFSRGPQQFLEDLRLARPTLMLAVPRLWERLLSAANTYIEQSVDRETLLVASTVNEKLARDVKEFLGFDRAVCFISGGAICPPHLKREFRQFDIDISDFYGQTEILPLTYQRGNSDSNESVGTVAPGFQVRIGDSGEILGKGPGMALGYFADAENTAATFKDGWVHTGDKGEFDASGYLYITGRISDEFKTAKGKFVAPGPIEKRCSGFELVEQCAIVGLGLTQPIVFCTLSSLADGLNEDTVSQCLLADTAALNRDLENHERIGAVLVCREQWTIEKGLLTHTQKIIRAALAERFSEETAELAAQLSAGSRGMIKWTS